MFWHSGLLFIGQRWTADQRGLKTWAPPLPAWYMGVKCTSENYTASPWANLPCCNCHTALEWLLHIVSRTFNFKYIPQISHFLYYPGMSCWITPQICFSEWTKNSISSNPGFTLDGPNPSRWLPQACVRWERGSRKPWNKLDKCYFWRNV